MGVEVNDMLRVSGEVLPDWAQRRAWALVAEVRRIVAESEGELEELPYGPEGRGVSCCETLPPESAAGVDALFGPRCPAPAIVVAKIHGAKFGFCDRHVFVHDRKAKVDISGLPWATQADLRRRCAK